MRSLLVLLVSALLLTACASTEEQARVQALYEKYDAHCQEHARKDLRPDADDELRYRECMDYFVGREEDCPHCGAEKYMMK